MRLAARKRLRPTGLYLWKCLYQHHLAKWSESIATRGKKWQRQLPGILGCCVHLQLEEEFLIPLLFSFCTPTGILQNHLQPLPGSSSVLPPKLFCPFWFYFLGSENALSKDFNFCFFFVMLMFFVCLFCFCFFFFHIGKMRKLTALSLFVSLSL